MLGRMSKDILSFFEGENQKYEVLGFGGSADITRALCPAAGPIPATVPAKAKTMPVDGAFRDNAGWECMGTTWSSPTYYSYRVNSPNQVATLTPASALSAAAAGHSITAVANGDLDGDITGLSTFRLRGNVLAETNGSLVLTLATTIEEVDPEE